MTEKPKAATFRKVLRELKQQVAANPTNPEVVCCLISELRTSGVISYAQAEVCRAYVEKMVHTRNSITLEGWIDYHKPELQIYKLGSYSMYRRSNATRIAWVKHIIQVLKAYENEQQ